MEEVYRFLEELAANNNKEWFAQNKSRYDSIQKLFNSFVEDLILEISKWDKDIDADKLQVKDCTYRIYRDVRFSKNKSPYKTHIGAYICKGGKKSNYAGYYFHIEPNNDHSPSLIGTNMLFAGMYMPDPKILFSIRDEISVNGDSFLSAINDAKGFMFDYSNSLIRLPKGFEKTDKKWEKLIKCKEFSLYSKLDKSALNKSDIAKIVSDKFKSSAEFIHLLNRAVDYVMEDL